jgi:hypothetical protein
MAQQTAVELLHEKSNELITQYLDNKISKRDLITMHHNILYPYKKMEIEVLEDCWIAAEQSEDSQTFFNYYNETYNNGTI